MDYGSRHLLCKDCFQGLIQDLRQVAKACGTVSDG
ncbi:tripartite motif-containing protein 66 isoform X1 [Prionailurus iriomotensis]